MLKSLKKNRSNGGQDQVPKLLQKEQKNTVKLECGRKGIRLSMACIDVANY